MKSIRGLQLKQNLAKERSTHARFVVGFMLMYCPKRNDELE